MREQLPGGFTVEPLGAHHDRSEFNCGEESLNRYLQSQASQDQRRNLASVYVLRAVDSAWVAGYYTLSTAAVPGTSLPEGMLKKLPRYKLFPATLLGRLAVDSSHKGQGLGELLLVHALRRALGSSGEVASMVVVVDALHDRAAQFYRNYGFTNFSEEPLRLFITMSTIQKLFPEK